MEIKDDQWDSLYVFAKSLEDKHIGFLEIEEQLSNKTSDKLLISEIMKQLKKVHYAVKRKQGFTKLGFGAIFLVLGFFITVFNFYSNQSFTIIMYSSSMVGLMLIFWGLYEIIG